MIHYGDRSNTVDHAALHSARERTRLRRRAAVLRRIRFRRPRDHRGTA